MADNNLPALPSKNPVELLTVKERFVYDDYCATDNRRVDPKMAEGLFKLFLAGKTCLRIQELNPDMRYGAIIKARIDGRWDERKEQYQEALEQDAHEKLAVTVMEQVTFLNDVFGAISLRYGDKLAKYRQTGEEKHLEGVPLPHDWKDYERMARILMMLTGQTVKKTETKITHEHVNTPVAPLPGPLTPEGAAKLLEGLDEK